MPGPDKFLVERERGVAGSSGVNCLLFIFLYRHQFFIEKNLSVRFKAKKMKGSFDSCMMTISKKIGWI